MDTTTQAAQTFPIDIPKDWAVPTFTLKEFGPRTQQYCVIIPIINEGERIQKQLREMSQIGIHTQADVILADGGSSDGSLENSIIQPLNVRTLLTKTGPGKLSAQLRMAYAYALQQGYEGIITIDGNGKDGVDAIPSLIAGLQGGAEFIQASRFVKGGRAINTPFVRWAAIRFIHAPLISLGAHQWFTDTTNGFRAYTAKALLDPRVAPFRDVFMTYELLAYLSVRLPRLGYKSMELPATRAYPDAGPTPTKIGGHSAHADLLKVIWKAISGAYNPR